LETMERKALTVANRNRGDVDWRRIAP
jgi:hypothetical protein